MYCNFFGVPEGLPVLYTMNPCTFQLWECTQDSRSPWSSLPSVHLTDSEPCKQHKSFFFQEEGMIVIVSLIWNMYTLIPVVKETNIKIVIFIEVRPVSYIVKFKFEIQANVEGNSLRIKFKNESPPLKKKINRVPWSDYLRSGASNHVAYAGSGHITITDSSHVAAAARGHVSGHPDVSNIN